MRHKHRIAALVVAVAVLRGPFLSAQGLVSEDVAPGSRPLSRCVPPVPPTGSCWSDWAAPPVEDFHIETENNVYAAFFLDARNPGCAAAASTRLNARLRETFDLYGPGPEAGSTTVHDLRIGADLHPFRTWLSGSIVTHLFAAARELELQGVPAEQDLLRQAAEAWFDIPVPQDPGCGLQSLPWVNSCMDDFALTAAGFAWIAAWEASGGRAPEPGRPWAARARSAISAALSPMSDNGGGPCFFALEILEDGSARARCDAEGDAATIMGADHNQETPNYGLGLMTSIATACDGLEAAGAPCVLTDREKTIARELFRHAQRKASSDGSTFEDGAASGCLDFVDPSGPMKPCSEAPVLVWSYGGYRPTDYPVRAFFDRAEIGGLLPAPYFQFDRYCESRTGFGSWEFWGPNRKVLYEVLGWEAFLPKTSRGRTDIWSAASSTLH